jgi:preprotein translocase subunit SecA
MIRSLAKRALNFRADRRLDRYLRTADAVIEFSARHRALSAEGLRAEADALRKHGAAATDDLVVPAFALVREAARRSLDEEHVREQIVAGLALHEGALVEMKTGEGKTLAATLAAFLNSLAGRPVHVATPNDHLAGRDADWMRPLYEALGTTVGAIRHDMDDDARRTAYAADVTYGPASEFGFDFLRDNMRFAKGELVQRGLAFALIDEADAIMIDEARVPLSLFGPLGDQSAHYQLIDRIVATLDQRHYDTEPGRRRVALNDAGATAVEQALRQAGLLKQDASLYDTGAIVLLHHVTQALRAHALLKRDRDYVVHDGAVIIVDGLTGRLMPGRRYDDGLHQALEAKEGQPIAEESRILASIPFQTFLCAYDKLSGMTGTAAADADEYRDVYGLETVIVPTHRPGARIDATIVHASRAEKLEAILGLVEDARARQQPVLIGTPTIERSETLAKLLKARGWQQHDFSAGAPLPRDSDGAVAGKIFAVLNARYHAREAQIIAEAGLPGAVTIATAMAGRGTDIRLGGQAKDEHAAARVRATGGLLVIGTEPHDHARLDDQLRGRAGRQGDVGRTSFHLAPDDDLIREGMVSPLQSAHADLATTVRIVQARHAARSFEERLSLARFDRVVDLQRRALLSQRTSIRDGAAPLDLVRQFREATIDDLMARFMPVDAALDAQGLDASVRAILTLAIDIDAFADRDALRDHISTTAEQWMAQKIATFGLDAIGEALRRVMLALIDQLWAEQLERLDHLRCAIGDRRLPRHRLLADFRIEAFASFEVMLKDLRHEVTAHAMRLGIRR